MYGKDVLHRTEAQTIPKTQESAVLRHGRNLFARMAWGCGPHVSSKILYDKRLSVVSLLYQMEASRTV